MKDILVIDNLVSITLKDSETSYDFWDELGKLNIPGFFANPHQGEALSIFAARHLPAVIEAAHRLNIEIVDVRSSL